MHEQSVPLVSNINKFRPHSAQVPEKLAFQKQNYLGQRKNSLKGTTQPSTLPAVTEISEDSKMNVGCPHEVLPRARGYKVYVE